MASPSVDDEFNIKLFLAMVEHEIISTSSLMSLKPEDYDSQTHFEKLIGKGAIANNEHFIILHKCLQLYSIILKILIYRHFVIFFVFKVVCRNASKPSIKLC